MPDPIVDFPGEVWKPVVGYELAYEVSNSGRVRSLDRVVPRRSSPMRIRGKLLAAGRASAGYLTVDLQTRTHLVHRLVLCAHVREPKPGEEARHLDGNRRNNNADNLAWGTAADNALDKIAHGRVAKGFALPHTKLTPHDKWRIYDERRNGTSAEALASAFGVHRDTIYRVAREVALEIEEVARYEQPDDGRMQQAYGRDNR